MSDEPRKVPLRVRLPYGSEAEFSTRYGAHVTRSTLFLATRAPKPEGTALTFELVLSDGSRLMRGEGLVQAVTIDPAPGKSGMLVRLTRVDAHTKALIEQIVARRSAGAAPVPAAPTAPEVAPLAAAPAATASGTFSVDEPLPAPPPLSAPPGLTRVRPHDRVAPLLDTLPTPRPGGPTAAPGSSPSGLRAPPGGSSPSRPPFASSGSGSRRDPAAEGGARPAEPGAGSSPSGLRRTPEPGGATTEPSVPAWTPGEAPAAPPPVVFPPFPASAVDEPFGTRPGVPPLPFPTSALSGPDGLGPGDAPPAPDLPPLAAPAAPVQLGAGSTTPTLEVPSPPGAWEPPPAGAAAVAPPPEAPEAAGPAPLPGGYGAATAALLDPPPLELPPALPSPLPEAAAPPSAGQEVTAAGEAPPPLPAGAGPAAVEPWAAAAAPVRPVEEVPFVLEPGAAPPPPAAGAGKEPADLSDVEALLPDFPTLTPPGARPPSGGLGAVRRTPVPEFPSATPSVPWSSFRPEPPERSTDSGSRRLPGPRPSSGTLPSVPGTPGARLTPEPQAPARPGRVPTESDLRPTPPVAADETAWAPPPPAARPGAAPPPPPRPTGRPAGEPPLAPVAAAAPASSRSPIPRPAPAEARPPAPPPGGAATPVPTGRPGASRVLPNLEEDEVVLGVDLGTWVCRAAVHVRGVPQPVPILTELNGTSLPAAVGWDPDKGLVVGSAALALRSWRPELTVRGVKRLVGRRARPAAAREARPRFPLELVPDASGDVAVKLGERAFPVPALLGALLDALKTGAEAMVGRRVRKVVIGVPAWFTEHQRAQVLEGARAADLEVSALLNEPSAVALAFGAGRGLARKRLLVYDLGAGAFQVAVVEITGEDLEVVAVGADESLGGMDFDARLGDALLGTLGTPERPATVSRAVLARVRDAAETAKRALDDQLLTRVVVPELGVGEDGLPRRLDVDVERAALERVSRELVERTMGVTRQVLDSARLTARSLDEVVLIGGQGRSAVVRLALEELLGLPLSSFEAGHAVAIGAAHFGHSLMLRRQGKRATSLSEVLAQPISVAVQGGGLQRVLDQNTRLPAEKSLTIPVRAGRQVAVPLFQGTSGLASEADYLGCARLSSPRDAEVAVRFSVGADGRLGLTPVGPTAAGVTLAFDGRLPAAEELAALLAQTPLPGRSAPASAGGGLLGGLKRLFGK